MTSTKRRAKTVNCRDRTLSCGPTREQRKCTPSGTVDGLEGAVNDYLAYHRPLAAEELAYFSDVLTSDEEAVSKAALAEMHNRKRHPHQRRIPGSALKVSEEVLLANFTTLRRAKSFDDLIDHVDNLIRPIPDIGELTVYDTALRIGARFNLKPTRVYLHAGARDGARALGFDGRRATIEMDELPEPLRMLSAREVEDLLCIYKDSFGCHGK
jgi:hypothetical protein